MASTCSVSPLPSLPMAMAQRRRSSARTSSVSSRRAAPYSGSPAAVSRCRMAAASVHHTGMRNTAPMDERSVLTLYGSAQPVSSSTPSQPKASAVRSTVPTLPGSCTPSSTT